MSKIKTRFINMFGLKEKTYQILEMMYSGPEKNNNRKSCEGLNSRWLPNTRWHRTNNIGIN